MAAIQPIVLKYLTDNANLTVFVQDIANDLGLTKKQVINALYNLRQSGLHNIEKLGDGAVAYHGIGKNGAVTFGTPATVLALLNSGHVVVEIEGVLYVAKELEV